MTGGSSEIGMVRTKNIETKLLHVILAVKLKLEIFCLVVKILTNHVEMKITIEFIVEMINVGSVNMVLNSLIRFLVPLNRRAYDCILPPETIYLNCHSGNVRYN